VGHDSVACSAQLSRVAAPGTGWSTVRNLMSIETESIMPTKHFKRGDHVSWNSEAGRVRGTITRVITSEIEFKGYKVHASKDEPQYEIKSDTTDHIAMHKASALSKLSS
jgi:hypothetical protein